MTNLLTETLGVLQAHGKSPKDVQWVGTDRVYFTWEEFEARANVEYDSGYGSPKVAQNLLIVGRGFWLERGEYDGSEWWDFKSAPKRPNTRFVPVALTIQQAEDLGFDVSCGWEDLEKINDLKLDKGVN